MATIIDMVNNPSHYHKPVSGDLLAARNVFCEDSDPLNLECIEAMASYLHNVDEIRGYLRGNSFKYRWRYRHKNGLEDLRKAKWYEDKLLKLEEAVDAYWKEQLEAHSNVSK